MSNKHPARQQVFTQLDSSHELNNHAVASGRAAKDLSAALRE